MSKGVTITRVLYLELPAGKVGVEGRPVTEAVLEAAQGCLNKEQAGQGVSHSLIHHVHQRQEIPGRPVVVRQLQI